MTSLDRLKQLATATLIVASVSSCATFLLVRYERAAGLFSGSNAAHSSIPTSFGDGPINDGCPRHDRALRKDLTIRFFREMPLSRFDGWIAVIDERLAPHAVLYRGPYHPIITIRDVCYDEALSGGNKLKLKIELLTKHHIYIFDVERELDLDAYSEADVMFWVTHSDVPRATLESVR